MRSEQWEQAVKQYVKFHRREEERKLFEREFLVFCYVGLLLFFMLLSVDYLI